jgi:hypothetical protein
MRFVVFPSHAHADGTRPTLPNLLADEEITVLHGPTPSGLYLIACDIIEIEILTTLLEPYYILMEDFEDVSVH